MMAIKSLVLDLGNVVVDVDYSRFCREVGFDVSAFEAFYRSPFLKDFEIGNVTRNEYFEVLKQYIAISDIHLHEIERNIYKAFPLRLRTWGLIHFLKRRMSIYLLSNTNSIDFENIDAYVGLRETFDKVYLSYEQKRTKPDPETFHHAACYFSIRPEETLFCDDREENIQGAQKAGWNVYQVNDESSFIDYLVKTLKIDKDALAW